MTTTAFTFDQMMQPDHQFYSRMKAIRDRLASGQISREQAADEISQLGFGYAGTPSNNVWVQGMLGGGTVGAPVAPAQPNTASPTSFVPMQQQQQQQAQMGPGQQPGVLP